MATYDPEALLFDIKSYLQGKLGTKLTELTAEKGDSLSIATPKDKSYFIQALTEEEVNYDPYVFIGIIEPIPTASAEAGTNQKITVDVAIVFQDDGADPQMFRKFFRYQRALMEIFDKGWNRERPYPLEVKGFPIPLPPEERKQIVGVKLTTNLA